MAVGRYGDAPWGQIGPPTDESYGPQATGIPGVVRVIYVPESQPIVVRNLDPHTAYSATYFDPVSGVLTKLGSSPSRRRWLVVMSAARRHKPRLGLGLGSEGQWG